MKWNVPKIWPDADCWIIGGGPSVARQFNVPEEIITKVMTGEVAPNYLSRYMKCIHDKHVIAVNNAYMIGAWIDVVFFGDSAWYLTHRNNLASWPGLKVSCAPREGTFAKDNIKYLEKDKKYRQGISPNRQAVAWNSNSGASAINLAVHFGVKRIFLLGFDMSLDKNKVSHWHGSHATNGKRMPSFSRHLRGFPKIAEDAKAMGIEILNASPGSSIIDFPIINAKDLL